MTHLLPENSDTAAFCARNRLLRIVVAFLQMARHQVQLDQSVASEDIVLAFHLELGKHVLDNPGDGL